MTTQRIVLSVVGARPNFMKLAPLARALNALPAFRHIIVHTGQHHDPQMSASFFHDLGIPAPHHSLHVGSGSHAQQTATVMYRLEPLLTGIKPEVVVVYGDVNSTIAAALTATKLGIRVAHVEAGLRSRDREMPEEINRILTDHCADLLFAPSPDGVENLCQEGINTGIHLVGNIMIDSLVAALPRARQIDVRERFGMAGGEFALATLHRPSNVDDPVRLASLVEDLELVSRRLPVVFPVHPRTRTRLRAMRSDSRSSDLRLIEPVGYHAMLALEAGARFVITDSGGVQEETSYLGVPCLTVRATTERPITCTMGTNRLVPLMPRAVSNASFDVLAAPIPSRPTIPLWDGHTAERIATILEARPEGRSR